MICCNRVGRLEEDKLRTLQRVVERTGAHIVLSTDWRRTARLKTRLQGTLLEYGVRCIGATMQGPQQREHSARSTSPRAAGSSFSPQHATARVALSRPTVGCAAAAPSCSESTEPSDSDRSVANGGGLGGGEGGGEGGAAVAGADTSGMGGRSSHQSSKV